ncbi:MAG: SDR family NAD(P)-dependent oxidoreductase, partial [Chloroflexi bacterium]|nr:SDR family NAD(P)-dependent oxidoreductase [Chloroflexota bacterium]
MNLDGKSAVVTGGGNGIGRALCLALAREGVNLAVADIDAAAAKAVADEARGTGVEAVGIATDVTDEDAVND